MSAKELKRENIDLRASSDEHAKGYIQTRKRIAAMESEIDRLHARNAVLESATARAERAEAELAAERARMNDLVADINDACITLASAIADCDDYALQNTEFKIRAVRDVLLQYIPHAAMKEGAK